MLAWRIYYGDGSTYSSEDGPPELAPSRDVQVIVQMEGDKRILMHGGVTGVEVEGRQITPNALGYYWFKGGEWYIGDYPGFLDYLMYPGVKITKFGRTIATARFHKIMQRAIDDPAFIKLE